MNKGKAIIFIVDYFTASLTLVVILVQFMRTLRKFIKISRIMTVFFLTGLGVLWLALWWYTKTKFDTELSISPFIILMGLNLIGAFSDYKNGLTGTLCMILFTVLSCIAPSFLAVPFLPGFWFIVFYILLISVGLVMLFYHVKVKKNSNI